MHILLLLSHAGRQVLKVSLISLILSTIYFEKVLIGSGQIRIRALEGMLYRGGFWSSILSQPETSKSDTFVSI
jgi:hypothetical protein